MDCKGCAEQVKVRLKTKEFYVDKCLKEILEALNAHPDIRTTSSCCGHGGKGSFMAMIRDDYVFFEIDFHTPHETWAAYRPSHEAMTGEKRRAE